MQKKRSYKRTKRTDKEICEQARDANHWKYHDVRNKSRHTVILDENLESDLPEREGMRHRHLLNGTNVRYFTDSLSPVYGLVRKWVGRKYDDVYSLLSKRVNKQNTTGQHVFDHFKQYITTDIVVREDDVLLAKSPYAWNGEWRPLSEWTSIEYYVDPRTGIIKKNNARELFNRDMREKERRDAQELAEKEKWVDADTVFRKVDDVWYVYEVRDVPICHRYTRKVLKIGNDGHFRTAEDNFLSIDHGKSRYNGHRDIWTMDYVCNYARPTRHEKKVERYHATKRQASKKELRNVGLR